jgi:hypothetical protein
VKNSGKDLSTQRKKEEEGKKKKEERVVRSAGSLCTC